MRQTHRRQFLADVGRGMLMAGLGSALTCDMGLSSSALAADGAELLDFGPLESLAALMQDTPAAKLQPLLVEKLHQGTTLQDLTCAGALANARSFGGQDYIGYHTLMAMIPALDMSRELPQARAPLPVLKVLYRNAEQIQAKGGRKNEALRPVEAANVAAGQDAASLFREAIRRGDLHEAEELFAYLRRGDLDESWNQVVQALEENTNVHRIVLTHRSYAMLDLVGKEHAETLLRQAVRFCADNEANRIKRGHPESPLRALLPRLFDQFQLAAKNAGTREADDAWVGQFCETLLSSKEDQAGEAVAAALAEGFSPEAVGEAIALAANQLVLRDPGRKEAYPGKPAGSVHGDSVGVHASDAVNAWRGIARVSNSRNTFASLIVAGWHMAQQSRWSGTKPIPLPEHLEGVKETDTVALLRETETAIRANDQMRATALVHRCGELGVEPRGVFDLLLQYAVSEDGALHAEKYYRTVTEEFSRCRPAYRWRHLSALARVTASEYGKTSPGYQQAVELLRLT